MLRFLSVVDVRKIHLHKRAWPTRHQSLEALKYMTSSKDYPDSGALVRESFDRQTRFGFIT